MWNNRRYSCNYKLNLQKYVLVKFINDQLPIFLSRDNYKKLLKHSLLLLEYENA